MAGLEKYEATEEWKNNFKKLLFMERKTVLKTSETIKETQRYSMDISSELQNILKDKNIVRSGETPKMNKVSEHGKKENHIPTANFSYNRVHLKGLEHSKNMVDDTLMEFHEKGLKKQDISDESFEAMEQMCDKTASDPDSTLFQYLNSNNKREIIEATKKRRSDVDAISETECDAETEAIDRLLNNLRGNSQQQIADESPLRGVEMTQIEDIEAPSRFWDNTVLQTSPVKMVGLLRPSTIMEEGADMSDVSSAQTSYKSALRALPGEISSSCYETASETTSSYCNPVKSSNTDNDPLYIENSEVDPLLIRDEDFRHVNVASDLIDFEKTMAASNTELICLETTSTESNKLNVKEEDEVSTTESDESIIELLSDEENPLSPFGNNKLSLENIETTPSIDKQRTLIKWDTPFQIKRENMSISCNQSSNTSNNATESPGGKENSLHFNDTLEEVEYMMKKGMEMIEADNAANESSVKLKNTLTPNILKERQNTFTVSSPSKQNDQLKSPFSDVQEYHHGALPKNTLALKSPLNAVDRFALNMKPMPKFDLFKKPTSACKAGSLAARHKDQFAHVVSPIGTYVKKTAMAPLMTTTKTNKGDHNSTAFRELEYESRLYQPKFNRQDNLGTAKILKSPNARTLPKKAYISSEFRQITDERSPVTIPGGKKIQKYLDAAVLPAVIRHDGKAKMPYCTSKLPIKLQKTDENNSNTPKRQEGKDISLANLSIMSGDVSVYTIKDAQKL